MEPVTTHRVRRRRDRGSFRVVPQEAENERELYAVVGPSGAALYTFTDARDAIAEASALNSAPRPDRGSLRLVVGDEE
jgi:hypothetical protein